MQEQVTNISQEVSDWSVRSSGLQAELEREREERKAEVHKLTERFQEESKVTDDDLVFSLLHVSLFLPSGKLF